MGQQRKFSPHIRWTEFEVGIVQSLYRNGSHAVLLKNLPGRTWSQIQNKANLLGIARYKAPVRTPDQVREAKRLFMAKRRLDNPEAARRYGREHHQENRDVINARIKKSHAKRFFWRRARRLKSDVVARDLASLWKKQRGLCAMTGEKLDRTAQLDHITAKARGGSDQIENLQWVCSKVNLAKRELSDAEFIELCRSVAAWVGSSQ